MRPAIAANSARSNQTGQRTLPMAAPKSSTPTIAGRITSNSQSIASFGGQSALVPSHQQHKARNGRSNVRGQSALMSSHQQPTPKPKAAPATPPAVASLQRGKRQGRPVSKTTKAAIAAASPMAFRITILSGMTSSALSLAGRGLAPLLLRSFNADGDLDFFAQRRRGNIRSHPEIGALQHQFCGKAGARHALHFGFLATG